MLQCDLAAVYKQRWGGLGSRNSVGIFLFPFLTTFTPHQVLSRPSLRLDLFLQGHL